MEVHRLDMRGGCVLNILVPAPETTNPLTGSIAFTGTFFPENRNDYLLEGPQPYRNMRHHLHAIENAQMANKFHSLELAVEREDDTLANKIFSNLYKYFSDYGASTLRPIGWWVGILISFSLLVFSVNGAVRGNSDDAIYTGWKTAFLVNCEETKGDGVFEPRLSSRKPVCVDTVSKRAIRSMYLSIQTMLNPLGIFSTKNVATTSTGWLLPLLLFQGLLSAVFIALMIFAIRRRFKMQ